MPQTELCYFPSATAATLSSLPFVEGQSFLSYKDVCNILNEPVKSGQSKKAQLKLWETRFKWRNEGHRWIIEEIFLLPKMKKKRKNSEMEAKNMLILFNLLEEMEEKILEGADEREIFHISRTHRELFTTLGFCNDNFYENKKYLRKDVYEKSLANSIFQGIPLECVFEFYSEVESRGRSHLEYILDSLHKQYFVQVEKSYEIRKGLDGRVASPATEEEHIAIREAINATLLMEKWQRKGRDEEVITMNEHRIVLERKMQEFVKDVLKQEKMKELEITSYYPIFIFSFTASLRERLERYVEIIGLEREYRKLINRKSVEFHKNKTRKKIQKAGEIQEQVISEYYGKEEYKEVLESKRLYPLRKSYEGQRNVLIDATIRIEDD